MASKKTERHGGANTRLYRIWRGMKARCFTPSSTAFPYYGGRGIGVCVEWTISFRAFREWANAHGYAENLELDRIDANGRYEPSNCRWVSRFQQMANRRKRTGQCSSAFKGVSRQPDGRWMARISANRMEKYLGRFASEEEAAAAYAAAAKEMHGEFSNTN